MKPNTGVTFQGGDRAFVAAIEALAAFHELDLLFISHVAFKFSETLVKQD